ncbi:hypothetical protein DFH09DRAFT_1146248 [Mycena vulgaris]|nr:hypothetical protein DFH09DRAFT_1146248 [Mycena vulgaris]
MIGQARSRGQANNAMPPAPYFQVNADCQAMVTLATHAMRYLPCARCMFFGLLASTALIGVVWFALPTRLCRKMVDCFCKTERLYHGSILRRLFRPSSDPETTELFNRLQRRVSHIQERRLRNSLRPWRNIWDMFRGHSFVILRCIWDIKVLKNRIEVLQEIRLRQLLDDSHGEDSSRLPQSGMRHTRLLTCDC